MKNLYIISEGRTEVNFVKNVLAYYLLNYNLTAIPITVPSGESKRGTIKGGWRGSDGYKHAIREMVKIIKTNDFQIHTTFFDLYGFPGDIPCRDKIITVNNPYKKLK